MGRSETEAGSAPARHRRRDYGDPFVDGVKRRWSSTARPGFAPEPEPEAVDRRPRRRTRTHPPLASSLLTLTIVVAAIACTSVRTEGSDAASNTSSDIAAPPPSSTGPPEIASKPADRVWVANDRLITLTDETLSSAPLEDLDDSVVVDGVWDAAIAGQHSDLVIALRRDRTEQAGLEPATESWTAHAFDVDTLQERWSTPMPIPLPSIARSSPVQVVPAHGSRYAVVAAPDSGPSTLSGRMYGLDTTDGALAWTTDGLQLTVTATPVPLLAVAAGEPNITTHFVIDKLPLTSIDVTNGDVTTLADEDLDDAGTHGSTSPAWNLVFSGDMAFDATDGRRVQTPPWLTPTNFNGPVTTYLGHHDRVESPTFVPLDDGTAVARHGTFLGRVTRDGDVLWQFDPDQVADSTIGLVVLGQLDGHLLVELAPTRQYAAIDLATGEQIWSAEHSDVGDIVSRPRELRLAGGVDLEVRRVGDHLVRADADAGAVLVTREPRPIVAWAETVVPAP